MSVPHRLIMATILACAFAVALSPTSSALQQGTATGRDAAATAPTPQLNGHPDLRGMWGGRGGGGQPKPDEKGNLTVLT